MTQSRLTPDEPDKPIDIQQDQPVSPTKDPRAELGLKSPTKDAFDANSRQEAQGQKATQFDGSPNPQGAPVSPVGPKDDTPTTLGKESRNDQ